MKPRAMKPRLKLLNGEMEVHVTADIAFAIGSTGRIPAMMTFVRCGAATMLESGRFGPAEAPLENDGL